MCTYYKDDVNKYRLQSQLPLIQSLVNDKLRTGENELSIHFIAKTLSDLSTAQRGAFFRCLYCTNEASFGYASYKCHL